MAGTASPPSTEPSSDPNHIGAPLEAKKIALKIPSATRPGTIAARRPRMSASRPPASTPRPPGVAVAMTNSVIMSPLNPRSVRR